ncbi:MAG: inositol-3-phosphate synthase [Alphaproteobacteria bacterium]|uniref:Inositol-3-phosphate synthase n=1 Tax=Candidatus Nitrobium versatile TaxID=2884831 RepID=A0A953M347_9BACT|nr:inositol-3-phosphate synthase [Candidatus Nitrobium versatile]
MTKVGVLFIGALGYIATTVIAGTLALKRNLFPRTGMVTDLYHFEGLDLVEPGDIVFGGWDIRPDSPYESARRLMRNGQLPIAEILPFIEEDVRHVSLNLYAGTTANCGMAIERLGTGEGRGECAPLLHLIGKLRNDIRKFRERNSLARVVVVNVASTEPPLDLHPCHESIEDFEICLERNRRETVRASTLYAYAAIAEGCPYINFTPSNGALIPALVDMAERRGVPVMGDDGKTGETLVKSALIPLFLYRNLEILSWEGFNLLGNMDGRILEDPGNRESKVMTKDRILHKTLGYSPHSAVHIHYVPSLDDQKTAWDFIHFRGFLGAKMSLQFIWQGYDSLLAAPLVLDLIRLGDLSLRRGERGALLHLSSFFKAPLKVHEHRLPEQFRMLLDYIRQIRTHGGIHETFVQH